MGSGGSVEMDSDFAVSADPNTSDPALSESSITAECDHVYGEWVVTKEPSCIEAGSRERVCAECGDTQVEKIAALEHSWAEEYAVDNPATCTSEGKESIHCAQCGAIKDGSTRSIAKLAHAFGEWLVQKEATYYAKGVKTRVCKKCGAVETASVPIKARTSLAKASIATIVAKAYTGKAFTPTPAVKLSGKSLKLGTDYKLSYKNNVKVGKATVTVTGIGKYSGSASRTFKICWPISKSKVSKIAAKTYKGTAFKPAPKITYKGKALKKGMDYKLSYKANVKAGTAQITITGKGSYIGSKTVKFKIQKASLSKAKVAKIANKTYTGKAIKPAPKVTFGGKVLKKGTDYTLSYSKNKAAGTARITVKGKGNYKGARTISFKIVKPKPKAKTSSSKNVNAGSNTGSSGDTVYITKTGSKYHLEWCSSLRKSKIPVSKSDAISRGFDPCKICNP